MSNDTSNDTSSDQHWLVILASQFRRFAVVATGDSETAAAVQATVIYFRGVTDTYSITGDPWFVRIHGPFFSPIAAEQEFNFGYDEQTIFSRREQVEFFDPYDLRVQRSVGYPPIVEKLLNRIDHLERRSQRLDDFLDENYFDGDGTKYDRLAAVINRLDERQNQIVHRLAMRTGRSELIFPAVSS